MQESTTYPSAFDLSFTWRTSGAEDAINEISAYYAVPTVSLRGALFDLLKSNSSAFPVKALYHDRHHPSAWGHSLMAQMVTKLLEQSITYTASTRGSCTRMMAEARSGAASGGGRGQVRGPTLWPPLYSKEDEAPIGTCVKDAALRDHIAPGAVGFRYLVEGHDAKMKPGIVGTRPGDTVRFCLDVSRLQRGGAFVLILGHLISYEHMGKATISCHDDCECEPVDVDAHVPGGKFSVFKAKTISAARRAAPPVGWSDSPATASRCGCNVQGTYRSRSYCKP